MDKDIESRLKALEEKINTIAETANKTRKQFMWFLIISVALFILPLIGLLFAIPSFIKSYSDIGLF